MRTETTTDRHKRYLREKAAKDAATVIRVYSILRSSPPDTYLSLTCLQQVFELVQAVKPGEAIVIEVEEMTKAEYDALPDFDKLVEMDALIAADFAADITIEIPINSSEVSNR